MARFKCTAPPPPPPPPPGPPASTEEGAAAVIKATVKLYDRSDGHGVNWREIAETLFKAAFDVLDRLPEDQKASVARRVHAGAYERVSGNLGTDLAPSKTRPAGAENAPSNTAVLKSSGPDPGNL